MNKILKEKTILFLEDNEEFATNTLKLLELYFKEAVHCVSMKSALKLFNEVCIDVVLSDLKVNDGIAMEFIKQIRSINKKVPIAVLSAHKDEELLLQAIPLGLMAYMIKPINFSEFEHFIELCNEFFDDNTTKIPLFSNVAYDTNRKSIFIDSKEISLTKKEIALLELLIANTNKVTTKEEIESVVWNKETMSEAALKNMLLRLRKKIGNDIVVTIQSVGYKLP